MKYFTHAKKNKLHNDSLIRMSRSNKVVFKLFKLIRALRTSKRSKLLSPVKNVVNYHQTFHLTGDFGRHNHLLEILVCGDDLVARDSF